MANDEEKTCWDALPVKFLVNNIGWTFNFVFAHILFWVYAFPAVLNYGYGDHAFNNVGALESGPSGSGVFPISLILLFVATLTWIGKVVKFAKDPYAADDE